MSPVTAVTTAWRRFFGTLLHYFERLDPESVKQFQAMYYVIFTVMGVSILVPGAPEQEAMEPMNQVYADMWIGLHVVCPLMTLAGRRLTSIASRIPQGKPNPAWPGALLMVFGDAGVWTCVTGWFVVVLTTPWWPRWLIVPAVMTMCVFGGGMFTARSLRRAYQIKRDQWREIIARGRHRRTA